MCLAALRGAEFSLTCFTALALLISGALQNRSRLSNWSPDYPLLIGNEATGDRPWVGRVFELVITDAATPLASARRFAGGESIVVPGTRIGAFDFSGSAPYRDAAGNLPDLNWTHIPLESGGVSNATTVTPWLQSDQPLRASVQRLEVTNAFTVRIRCATNNRTQAGRRELCRIPRALCYGTSRSVRAVLISSFGSGRHSLDSTDIRSKPSFPAYLLRKNRATFSWCTMGQA